MIRTLSFTLIILFSFAGYAITNKYGSYYGAYKARRTKEEEGSDNALRFFNPFC
jgi:hypothetical protein